MKNVENEAESSKFKVKDRRRFSPDGEPLEESPEAAEPEVAESVSAATAAAPPDETSFPIPATEPEEATAATSEHQEAAFDPSRFSAGSPGMPTASMELLVMSLAMQAELELGTHGKPEEQLPNLDLARHSIDMLAVLQDKTKGNLTFEEKRQLDNAVTMLRFRYVQAVQELNQKAKA
jgi:hypothetical protein